MEFLLVVFPGALLLDVAFVLLFLRDRALVKLVLAHHAEVFDTVRGRARRWPDDSELMWFQRRRVRRAVLRELEPRAASDPRLAIAIGDVRAAERWFRVSAWLAVAMTGLFILALSIAYRHRFG